MKRIYKILSTLLAACMVVGCMAVTAFAADAVVKSALTVGNTYPTVSGNWADTCYGDVTLDVNGTVSDQGALTYYTSYGLADGVNYSYQVGPVIERNSNPDAVEASVEAVGNQLRVTFTGKADGTATVKVLYTAQTRVNANQIYSGTNGVANGYLVYTVTVGAGAPVDPSPTPNPDEPVYEGWTAIHNETELKAVANDLTGKYYLANDVTIASSNWEPLGWTDSDDVPFTGYFYGNGHTISGLTADWNGTNVGLFAINEGTIQNLYIAENGVAGNSYVGVVCGKNRGTIDFVHVSGNRVVASDNDQNNGCAGGLVGVNTETGTITRCSSSVSDVRGFYRIGGLVGLNNGTIKACKATTKINGDMTNTGSRYYAGGLVGMNNAGVSDSYTHQSVVSCRQCGGGLIGGNASTASVSNSYVNASLNYYGSECYADIGFNKGTYSNCYSTNTQYTKYFTRVTSWAEIQAGLTNNGSWALDTDSPVKLTWEVKGWDENDSPLPSAPAAKTCDVTFEKGSVKEGDTVTLPENVTVDENTVVTLETPTRTNDQNWVYVFEGWDCGDGSHYEANEAYTVTGDVTFTAVWRLKTVDGDADWTYVDAMTIMDYLAGNTQLTDEQISTADYNGDGGVDYVDAMTIMDTLAGTV